MDKVLKITHLGLKRTQMYDIIKVTNQTKELLLWKTKTTNKS